MAMESAIEKELEPLKEKIRSATSFKERRKLVAEYEERKRRHYDVPLEELATLWLMKFGAEWVYIYTLDEFYYIAEHKLHEIGKIERSNLGIKPVSRIVE